MSNPQIFKSSNLQIVKSSNLQIKNSKPYTDKITKQLETDLKKHNQQYPPIELKRFSKSHDRFLIIDQKDVYHIGASLKDLGRKPVVSEVEPWFTFSKINLNPADIIQRLI